ncbi:MAG: WbuC family cupin fold metalloprotein [Pseudomonadota bacterium]|jgi:cupin fold WbuC family metalloprotein
METKRIITQELLDSVTAMARHSPRCRKNLNFHAAEADASHRLLNAMEPDSYIPPHCHLAADKDETIIVLRGKLGVIFFDAAGGVAEKAILVPGGAAVGVNIPHGVFHTVVALEPGSVFFEAKAGPYRPLVPEEKAGWAPPEGAAAAASYLSSLKGEFQRR